MKTVTFIQLKEEEKESVISSYSSSSSIAVTGYQAEKFVREWYKDKYGNLEFANVDIESVYSFWVPFKNEKMIAVIVKYMRNIHLANIGHILLQASHLPEGSDIYEKHVVFVVDDLEIIWLPKI